LKILGQLIPPLLEATSTAFLDLADQPFKHGQFLSYVLWIAEKAHQLHNSLPLLCVHVFLIKVFTRILQCLEGLALLVKGEQELMDA
jgi:hypothetical protein